MLDLRLIRERPDFVKGEIAKLYTQAPIDEILVLDSRRREFVTEVEVLKARLNAGSRETGRISAGAERDTHIAQMRDLGDRIAALDTYISALSAELDALLLTVPNLPSPETPVGRDESENVVTATFGELRDFGFMPKPHWELAEALGIIDFERGVKVSGSRFNFLRGAGARLQRALITWMLDLRAEQGYDEVYPPYLVREEAMVGAGNLPKFEETLFKDREEGLWLIPTAEVPVTNMYRDEILSGTQLPIHHSAYSPCFRNEKASAGRDVRGIKRVYQFDKVEMVKFVEPEASPAEHLTLVEDASETLHRLEIPFRHLEICTGDLSFVAARKIDLEAWAPGCEEWLEVSSCSNFGDFQARRANIRYRPDDGGRPRFVHTLNGSGLGLPRTMIAVIENYQREDGSIDIPTVLRPYLGGMERIVRS
ncbi:MAG TPA: serine--tRNA ligase [Thermomicrobiales bacterium]|nr:serine--tRNA ligase [Thermomicrobiales bacterium]